MNVSLFPSGRVPNEDPTWGIGPETTIVGSDGITRVYNVTEPLLEPFAVLSSDINSSRNPAVVIAPGGGYSLLAWDLEGTDVAQRFNEMGVNAFVLKYRVPARPALPGMPKWWAPLQDSQRAVSWVRAHADEFGVDSEKIGFAGFSAGGHLTAHISTAWGERIYDPIDDVDTYSSRPDFSVLTYPWFIIEKNQAESTTVAEELRNLTDAPPAFLAHAADDATAPFQNSVQYFQHLLANSSQGFAIMPRLEVDPAGGHGFGLCQHAPHGAEEICSWPEHAESWLKDIGML